MKCSPSSNGPHWADGIVEGLMGTLLPKAHFVFGVSWQTHGFRLPLCCCHAM